MRAELDGLICSGPQRGRQTTHALLEERVPPAPALHPEEALRELARRYFTTRGPATVHDFSWWSGLTIADARHGAKALESELEQVTVDGRVHWFDASAPPSRVTSAMAHLLPNYDEYFIGFSDRSAVLDLVRAARARGLPIPQTTHVIVIDGQIAGGWRRTLTTRAVVVEYEHLTPPTRAKQRAIETATRRYGKFLGLPVRVAHRPS